MHGWIFVWILGNFVLIANMYRSINIVVDYTVVGFHCWAEQSEAQQSKLTSNDRHSPFMR